ncbi:hypothetical protein HMPREF0569_1582 [Micrococcus luteus SK58]|uniref:hypothetical protein n=1 Tax=Micrococcus luteus TaxID=1270 RepID=UPI0001C4FFDC|nr:hypothetical protein [Micrococcus luteus]EFD50329.1 hypothetical protein HMPREF0569_1582 [Micrococcus luteus SK58]
MNPHTILRRLTALVGAALAGLRVRRLIREARLGCRHVHDRDAAAGAVVAALGVLVLAHRLSETEALVRIFPDGAGGDRGSVILTRGDAVSAVTHAIPFSCVESLTALAPAVRRLARAEVAA